MNVLKKKQKILRETVEPEIDQLKNENQMLRRDKYHFKMYPNWQHLKMIELMFLMLMKKMKNNPFIIIKLVDSSQQISAKKIHFYCTFDKYNKTTIQYIFLVKGM